MWDELEIVWHIYSEFITLITAVHEERACVLYAPPERHRGGATPRVIADKSVLEMTVRARACGAALAHDHNNNKQQHLQKQN